METVALADELVLLAYDDSGATWTVGDYLDYGVAGALLLQLGLAGRLEVREDRLVVADPSPTGDPTADAVLRRLSDDPARTPGAWIPVLARGARQPILDRLVDAGVLRREQGKVFAVFSRTRYPAPGGVEPIAERDARQRLRAAVEGDGPVEPRTAALGALLSALGWERQVLPDLPADLVRARMKELGAQPWAGAAIRQAVADVQLAVLAAMMLVVDLDSPPD
ncbi:GPP34 family phosphoprotein [Actinoplanes sp. M2I2]|uniref:GOLPH3/VPS74 family protein n=1 Tax=Actinoplanes sp. M2I2 TaxID=1734444 RepID=UPI002021C217|nr:GPP34 family phosphoprotein [Actinoplanes sp. M2I2]